MPCLADARCPMPDARCPMPHARCTMPDARCPMPHAPCPMPDARCPMPDARCPMPHARCPMPHARCPMPDARCPMPHARCPMPHAPCPMPHAHEYLIFLRKAIINYFLLGAIFSIEISASITDSTIGAATVPPEEPSLGSSITASTTYRGASTGIIPTKLVIIALLE